MIFIGYRRDDSPDGVGRLYKGLTEAFGVKQVFRDIDNLTPGVEFTKRITTSLEECRVFLAVIGPRWLDAQSIAGTRRLLEEHDFVRTEIEIALERDIEVVPVLLGNANLPAAEELPESIRGLSGRQAQKIRHDPDFEGDLSKLIDCLKEIGFSSGPPTSRSELWSELSNTRNVVELRRFEATFVATNEAYYARQRRDHLDVWNEISIAERYVESLQDWLYQRTEGFVLIRGRGVIRRPKSITEFECDELASLLWSVLQKIDDFLDLKPDEDLRVDATHLKLRVYEVADRVAPDLVSDYKWARELPPISS